MKILQKHDLHALNTMRLHSVAEVLYIPESHTELVEILRLNLGALLLAAGSNYIFPPQIKSPVVSLMKVDERLELLEAGCVRVGCSVRVQKLIRFLQEKNYGGIEYLYSVPATVGGLVYMNGGRGRKINKSISDYLQSVEYLNMNDMTVQTYRVNKVDFSYRTSPFQNMNAVILSCVFLFKIQDSNETEKLIVERLKFSKNYLSADKPSCGSVFKKGNPIVFRLLKGVRVGGAMFSKKTANWISNVDNASYDDICKLIKRAQFLHKLFLSRCELEVIIIEE